MAHGVGHCHCAHAHLKYCNHCDVAYCNDCKREWGWRLGGWTWYSTQPSSTYTITGSATNAFNVQTPSAEGHTHA